jgi:hypothetical protein
METNAHIHLKKLRVSATITLILGILSAIAVLFTYLALCDIASHEPDQTLEWYIVGVGLLIWLAFIVSTLVTIRFLFVHLKEQSKLK